MATYVPNATQTTEPVESRPVESAALEFRTLKTRINALEAAVAVEDVKDLRAPEATIAEIPAVAFRAGKVLGFDAGGDPIVIEVAGATDPSLRSDLAASSGASLVGYLQGGTGAVATTVQAKLRENVSVKDFGAIGDGVTDDTAAIQAAIASGSSLFFPFGTYLTGTLATTSAPVSISGQHGIRPTIKLKPSVNAHLFDIRTTTGVSFADVILDGNKANQTVGAVSRCLYLLDCHSIHLHNVEVMNAADHGVHISIGASTDPITDSTEAWITDCVFHDNGSDPLTPNGGSGLAATCRRLWVSDCYAYNNILSGFKFTGQFVVANGLQSRNNMRGGFTTGFDTVTNEGAYHTYTACLAIANGSLTDAALGGDGFRHQGQTDKIIHRDCVASNNTWSGITLLATSVTKPINVDIFGGQYNNNGQLFVASNKVQGAGIAILSTTSSSVPQNVRIDNINCYDDQATKTQQYGIYASYGDNITIGSGCNLSSNGTNSVFNTAILVTNIHVSPLIQAADFIVRSRTAVAVTGTLVETPVATLTVPANTLNPGQRYRMRVRGTVTGTAGTKLIRLYIGSGNSILSNQAAGDTQDWLIDAVVEITGSAAMKAFATGVEIGGQTNNAVITDNTALSDAITFKVTGTLGSDADSISARSFYFEPIY